MLSSLTENNFKLIYILTTFSYREKNRSRLVTNFTDYFVRVRNDIPFADRFNTEQ